MKILYIGDIYDQPGIDVVKRILPGLKEYEAIDLVIAQAENVSGGRGLVPKDMKTLQQAGVDFFTGGNWSLYPESGQKLLDDPDSPVIRPANYPAGTVGKGYAYADTEKGKVLVVSLLGSIVGKDADKPVDNPLQTIDRILKEQSGVDKVATVVNLHGDYSSEKVIFGYYLDGRVTVAVGDHWHVPTADAMILPQGTAHLTDVGMCGVLHSSLGIKLDIVIPRWRDRQVNRNQAETTGPLQFNALLVESDDRTGLATSIKTINTTLNN